MKIKKIKKYEIVFSRVDESINVDWISGSIYKSDHIIADTIEEAIEYVKVISNYVKDKHVVVKNSECNVLMNLISKKEDDFKTTDRDGYFHFHLRSPYFTEEFGNKTYYIAVEIMITPFIELKIK